MEISDVTKHVVKPAKEKTKKDPNPNPNTTTTTHHVADQSEDEDAMLAEEYCETKKKISSFGSKSTSKCCQVDKCLADLNASKAYHRRHRVCEQHAKAHVVLVDGIRQRFCQQCSRFHELSEFDEAKRSCRRRLAGHNERRRKIIIPSDKLEIN